MADYEAVLFDFDGVIIDSEPVHFACWREVLAPLGVTMTWEDYRTHCIGVADEEVLDHWAAQSGGEVTAARMWREYGRKNELFVARMEADPPIPEATRRLLEDLDGLKLAVVSSSGRAEVEPILVAGGVRQHFDDCVFREDVTNYKPHPEPYLLAARRLGIRWPLVVEDSEAGLQSGRAAGFDVVAVDNAANTALLVRQRLGLG